MSKIDLDANRLALAARLLSDNIPACAVCGGYTHRKDHEIRECKAGHKSKIVYYNGKVQQRLTPDKDGKHPAINADRWEMVKP